MLWRGVLKIDTANLSTEGTKLMAEVKRLEEENHSLARRLKDLQQKVYEKRRIAKTTSKTSDELKETLARLISEEKTLQNENRFLRSEKAKLVHIHNDVSKRLGADMSALEGTIKDIAFMKGEIGTLIEKKGMLEAEIPLKFRDADNLGEKITGTLKAMNDLHDRMKAVERNVKLIYYKKGNFSIT